MSRRHHLAIVLTLIVVATGCGSGDDATPTAEAAAAGDETPMAASSPLGAYFAEDGGFETALAEYRLRVEEQIVTCMAEEGFEFQVSGQGGVNPVEELQNEMTEREWTTEYGYGLSTSFDTVLAGSGADPNMEIVFGLPANERDIWLETLFGEGQQGFGVNPGARPLEEQGCIGASIIATGGQGPIEGLEEFGSAYEEGVESIFDQDEMIVAVQDWVACMAGQGFSGYRDLDDPEADIGGRFGTVTAPLQSALEAIDPDDARAVFSGEGVDAAALPGLDVEALRELQADELRVALADLDCYDAHVRQTYEPLRDALEEGLLSDYGTELDALRTIGS